MIKLEKNKIYKVVSTNKSFKRNYMIFSLRNDLFWNGETSMNFRKTIFLINLDGEFGMGGDMGIHQGNEIVELSLADWLELGHFLRGTKLRANLRTKKVTDIELENWEITEI